MDDQVWVWFEDGIRYRRRQDIGTICSISQQAVAYHTASENDSQQCVMRAVDATDLGRVLLECHRTVYWKQAAKSHVRHFCNLGLLRPSTKVNLEPEVEYNLSFI